MSDLVAELLELDRAMKPDSDTDLLIEAAAEIERLRADNQRMRELLLEWAPDERTRSIGW